jgi:crotonobetainyl-CoA:carnitine CoA-transferase CaiB-like acyl-CoA transferase
MTDMNPFLEAVIPSAERHAVEVLGDEALPGDFDVSGLAAASIASAGAAVRTLVGGDGPVRVSRRLASLWFASSLRPLNWSPPSPWNEYSKDYRTANGWVRLHTNAPHHRAAALAVLGHPGTPDAAEQRAATWNASELEEAVIAAGGAAATMHTRREWAASPAGVAVRSEPLVDAHPFGEGPRPATVIAPERPLQGIRVLDLTRVLAGPVATRFLALLGADVLRIDPPWWDEPALLPDVMWGKRSARLDLRSRDDLTQLRTLLADADVVIHGYRPGALEHLGLGVSERHRIRPGLVDVALDAYGWTGPWAGRRGFDSLVQMSTGIAAGRRDAANERPTPLPVQALDHATGYLAAAAAIRGIRQQRSDGAGSISRLSLARTAELLWAQPTPPVAPAVAITDDDVLPELERTGWGATRRLTPPLCVSGVRIGTETAARPLGSNTPTWMS